MAIKPKIPKNLFALLNKSESGEAAELILTDGRRLSCTVDCLTYANVSDNDDTDIMVAKVSYGNGYGELLAEEDIEKVIN